MDRLSELKEKYLQEIVDGCPNCRGHIIDLVSKFCDITTPDNIDMNSKTVCKLCGHEKNLAIW